MAIEDWAVSDNGKVQLAPVVDWTAARMGLVIGFRLSTAHLVDQHGSIELLTTQSGMRPEQAREFGQALCRLADQIDAQGTGTAQ
ncbi:MAG: hypothetical protein WC804_14875 [Sphingomonas sp.]|jgi:hypothetical protein|uniref:hypothetical protein n=1 Tax=Sphingomonas sp. TaxID=28214 RepID=UPI003568994B